MSRDYVPFIDWLKCLGMLVIVYGHVAAWGPLAIIPPINSKQFGVAFFLFITGYSLATATRDRWKIAFNRLFEIYLYGLALALLLSAIAYSRSGRLALSNYTPLAGVHVLFNTFPANPTTWYIGTYLHVLLIWAIVGYRIRVSTLVLVGAFLLEIACRMLLLDTAGVFVAYMALTNWLAVFLTGMWFAQHPDEAATTAHRSRVAAGALIVFVAGWVAITARMRFDDGFPFMSLGTSPGLADQFVASAMVSVLYLSVTCLVFWMVRPWHAPAPVRFVARNTLIIFLGHMPLYYVLWPVLASSSGGRALHALEMFVICVLGLGLLSEALRAVVRPRVLRDALAGNVIVAR
jgi:hypothetical protein